MFKQNEEKLVVGYDLSDTFSQMSYYVQGSEDVETLSLVAGTQNYNIPTVLCKRTGVNQWFYGKEALRYSQESGGILVQNLVQLAVDGEPILIEEISYEPIALLTLFFKRSLGMLSQIGAADKISALMITCDKLDYRMITILSQVVAGLKLKTDKVFFQSHTESFYNYMIHQPKELWLAKSLLFEYKENYINIYQMECNKRTTPIVAYIDSREVAFTSYEPMPEGEELRSGKQARLDEEFLHVAEQACRNNVVSSVYLIGEHFSDEWMKQSLRFLCKGRRVFQGNNLYSKGACYGMLERLHASEEGKAHVFLGNDKLKTNVGMKILRRGEESYMALLDAGINWFEAEKTLEFYLQDGKSVELILTSLIGGGSKTATITLEELKGDVSLLSMHLYLSEESRLVVEIEDLGFGELKEATHHVWQEEIVLYER